LHQAVEAKENVTVTQENNPLTGISRQQFFSLYSNLCGMTGTTNDSVGEFKSVYGLPVTNIPTHRPNQRIVQPMRIFSSEEAKLQAVVESVHSLHATGRPVLIGTRTIENSRKIAAKLGGLPFQMLNGVHDGEEAQIVAEAGRLGAIMIATNMAGRGTDIKLGEGVRAIGGLHVVVSEPNESARVDRQLMGRASRQGDPGSCQMFVSSDDSLIVEHAPWLIRFISKIVGPDEEVGDDISREIVKLQRTVERKKAASRREMFSKQNWMDDVMKTLAKK
jgi:preprotein translocase subunit SecA